MPNTNKIGKGKLESEASSKFSSSDWEDEVKVYNDVGSDNHVSQINKINNYIGNEENLERHGNYVYRYRGNQS